MREEKECKEKQAAPFGFCQTSLRSGDCSWIRHPFFSNLHLFSIHLTNDSQPSVLLFSPVSQSLPLPGGPQCARGSLFFLAGGDGDQLLGGFGDVIGALDDLLGEELVVHRTGRRVGGSCFTTLHLQAGRTGRQELQGRMYCI